MVNRGYRDGRGRVRARNVAILVAVLAVPAFLLQQLTAPEPSGAPSTLLAAAPTGNGECTSTEEDGCRDELEVASGWKVPFYRSYSLDGNPNVTHAIIAVHGDGRNGRSSFEGMREAAAKACRNGSTIVIAPEFPTSEDKPAKNEARWSEDGWKEGADAERPAGLSSFQVMDQIMDRLTDKNRFPALTRITLGGHSAGAQYAQRYAAGGRAPAQMQGITVDYVIANPSSYLYFDPERPTEGGLAVPSTACDYDRYKYGLKERVRYLSAVPDQEMIARYTRQRVTYLAGDADTELGDKLDDDCAAKLQGRNRLDRSARYFEYIKTKFPNAPHQRFVVPGVGHDRANMFASEQGRAVLFGDAGPGAGQQAGQQAGQGAAEQSAAEEPSN